MSTGSFIAQINPSAHFELRRIGKEKMPVLVIDDVLTNPDELRTYAVDRGNFLSPEDGSYYPGLNGQLPSKYGSPVVSALRELLETVFAIPMTARISYEGFFGLATLQPEELKPLQTIPHFDSANPRRLAMVHYLCGPPFEGTAFYRHKSSGFESINSPRVNDYKAYVFNELCTVTSPSYIGPVSDKYLQVGYVEARYNRLIVYSSTMLHSAILKAENLSNDPLSGRLTANSFIEIVE